MFEEVERYTSQFISDRDQMKANLAQALSGMLRVWMNLYGDLPTPQANEEVEKMREAVLSRGLVIQSVEPLPSTLKPGKRPDNFLLRVSRSGYLIAVDRAGNYPQTFVDLGTVRFSTLKTRGYNIHFFEDQPDTSGRTDSNMTVVAAGDSATKERGATLWRLEGEHPILGRLNKIVHRSTYEEIESQYQKGLDQILGENPELKP